MVHNYLFIYIAAGHHIWRSFPYPPPGDAAGSLQEGPKYQAQVAGKLTPIIDILKGDTDGCVNNVVKKMVDAFNNTSQNVLGNVRITPVKEWLSESTWKLVQEHRSLKLSRRESTDNRRHYNYLCREIKRKSQCDMDSYIRKICKGVEEAHAKENKGDLRQCA